MGRVAIALCLCCGLLLAGLGGTARAAEFAIENFDVRFEAADGSEELRAGAHPFAMHTSFEVATEGEAGSIQLVEAVRDLIARQVTGFVGDPTATQSCPSADFLTKTETEGGVIYPACPNAAVVGLVEIFALAGGEENESGLHYPVYNLLPSPGEAARLGFWSSGVPVTIALGVGETYPYKITGGPRDVSQLIEVVGTELTLWGVPAAPAHDPWRGDCLNPAGESVGLCSAGVSEEPFLTMPRACEGPLLTEWEARSWAPGSPFIGGAAPTHEEAGNPRGIEGCGELDFTPDLSAAPSSFAAESATGLRVTLTVTDEGLINPHPSATAAADVAEVVTILPPGVTANPGAAEGLGVCSAAQYQAESLTNHACPAAAKIGSMEAETPLLEEKVLLGSVYLASPDDNPFGSLLALYFVVREPELGIFVKLPIEVETDPRSGRLRARVTEIPPFPLSRAEVTLRSGPRAPLITPPVCGTHVIESLLYPSSGEAPIQRDSSFQISTGPGGGPCPNPAAPPFAPGLEAGSINNAAGAHSPFYMRMTREDGYQDITRFAATLPPGVTGKIAGLRRCSDAALAAAPGRSGRAELAAPSCPSESAVGRVEVGAGVGTALTYVPGSVYLAGPYNGAPLSVAAIVPAVAGPFDVGTVVTRVALNLNPDTAQVEVDGSASDPIPHILEGIPLKVRDIRVYADRAGFTLNPTSCAESRTEATIFGSGANPFSAADDTAAPAGDRYQAASCASLGFKPKLNLRLKGATKRAKNPGFRAELNSRGEDANLKGAIVNLPPSQFIDNAHISNPCTRVQFNAGNCPKRSILGRARAFTPLLDDPLEGNVYFRSNGGERELPDLVVALKGQFEFNLVIAVLRSTKDRIRTKVLNAPDAPVSKFVLNMFAGKRSLLENNEWLCRKKQRAYLNLIGQNGRRHKTQPVVKTSCGSKKKSKRAVRHR